MGETPGDDGARRNLVHAYFLIGNDHAEVGRLTIVTNLRRNSPQIHADFVTQVNADKKGRSAKISVEISADQRAILQAIFP